MPDPSLSERMIRSAGEKGQGGWTATPSEYTKGEWTLSPSRKKRSLHKKEELGKAYLLFFGSPSFYKERPVLRQKE